MGLSIQSEHWHQPPEKWALIAWAKPPKPPREVSPVLDERDPLDDVDELLL
jgi:hypothetical protein